MSSFDSPVIILTGAGGAMGGEIARVLATRGMRILCCDIAGADKISSVLRDEGFTVLDKNLDVRRPESWSAAVEYAVSRFGRIDGLVNAAGIMTKGSDTVEQLDLSEWQRVVDINLTGVFIGMRSVVPAIKKSGSGGRVVNIASASGLRGMPRQCAYSVSKAGVLALTRQAAVDLADDAITVNALAPGVMDAAMAGAMPSARREALLAKQPLKRMIRGNEVGEGVAYFLSESAAMITGEVLSIDGGWISSSI